MALDTEPITDFDRDGVERRTLLHTPVDHIYVKLVTVAVAISAVAFGLDILLPLGVAGGVPYVALVLVGWWFPKRPTIILLAVLSSLLTVAGYHFSPDGGSQWIVLINRAYALFAIWITAITLWLARRDRASLIKKEYELLHSINMAADAFRDMQEAREEAEAANVAKSNFLSTMSHELRTPLNAILGFSEIMKTQVLGPIGSDKYIEYAEDIHSSGSHLLSLVNDILHMAKIEAGNHSLRVESINVPEFIQECLIVIKGRASESGVILVNDALNSMAPLFADRRSIKQCMINLLSNAIKFTPRKGIVTITTSTSKQWYKLSVSDTGIGVAKDDLPKLTQPFTQIERTQTGRIQEGTGIGLTITRNLIEMHGGTLEVNSEVNVGTTVTIQLPRGQVSEIADGSVI